MAMIQSGRYSRLADFYKSRWLRIAVPYYFHLTAIVAGSVAAGLLFGEWLALSAFDNDPLSANGGAGVLAAAATNLVIFGQDAVLFLRDPAGEGLQFTANFATDPAPLYRYLVIPQCWSVSIELMFYALVPFLNRLSSAWLAVLLAASGVARFAGFRLLGLDHDPWVYRFFPFELAWFLAGMLGWRVLERVEGRRGRRGAPGPVLYAAVCCGVVAGGWVFRWVYNTQGFRHGPSTVAFLLLLAAVPFIVLVFHFTRAHRWDRLVGELSYPVYLNHLFIIITLRAIPWLESWQAWHGVLTGGLSVLAAWLFWRYFLREFEARRHRVFGLPPMPA